MKRYSFYAFLAVVFLVSSFSSIIYGLSQKSQVQKNLQHEVTVTLKLIQVYVTDKDGKPAMDLVKEDFEIYDKGELKKITDLEKHVLTLPEIREIPIVEKVQPEKVTPSPLPTKMNRKFFLFFDFAYNNVTGIKNSKEAALHFIDNQLQPNDEVCVLSYSSLQSLTLHEFLTTVHHKVREVVEGFGKKDVLGRADNVEEQYWRNKLQVPSPDAGGVEQGLSGTKFTGDKHLREMYEKLIRLDREALKQQTSDFSLKIKDFAKALRYIPGHKHIIFFSSGIPTSLMYGIEAPFGTSYTYNPTYKKINMGDRLGDSVTRRRYEAMIKEMAASNCKFYSIDTEELRTTVQKDEQMMGSGSLKQLASVTGGKYYDNVHDYESTMSDIQNLTGSYYVLGYYINEKWDGKYHKIKVKVKKKGYKVHAQGGYYNPKPFTEYSKLEKQIHLVDLALTERPLFQDPIRFSLEVKSDPTKEKNNLLLMSQISWEKFQEITGDKIEIVGLVFDERDNIVGFGRAEIALSDLSEETFLHNLLLSIPSGKYKCRVVIRNLETGRGAVGSASVEIPE